MPQIRNLVPKRTVEKVFQPKQKVSKVAEERYERGHKTKHLNLLKRKKKATIASMLNIYYTIFFPINLLFFRKSSKKPNTQRKSLTIIELLIVIFIISLMILFLVPTAVGAYQSSLQNSTFNTVQITLSRASTLSKQYYNIVGIRFVPASWVVTEGNTTNKQAMVFYRWEYENVPPPNSPINDPIYNPTEHLARLKVDITILPTNIWCAPKDKNNINYWNGTFGIFRNNPTNTNFVNADDFLILFFSGKKFTLSNPMEIFDYNVNHKELFKRYNTDGIVIYNREKVLNIDNPNQRELKAMSDGLIYLVSDNGELINYK